jgi:hypothetical protein
MTKEEAIVKARVGFEEMIDALERAGREGHTIDRVEEDLWRGILELGRMLLTSFVADQGSGDMGETIEFESRTLRRLEEMHRRRYVSVFGEFPIERVVYGTRETQKHEVVPLDARLGLPESDFSHLLQKWDLAFCAKNSYQESRASVQEILGIGQSVRSLEQMVCSAAAEVAEFRHNQPAPPADQEGSLVVLSADCKGVPMRREDAPGDGGPRGRRRKKGEKANLKRMACVGAVYTIEPFVRTADDIVEEILNRSCQSDRPVPQNKLLRAELTRWIERIELNGKEEVFGWFGEQLGLRNADGHKPVVCVMDGEAALWRRLAQQVGPVVGILDLFHVMEYLWKAAHCFHPEGSREAEEFVTQRLRKLLLGQVGRVIGGLRQMATKQALRRGAKKTLKQVIGYFRNNRKFMRYDEYLAAGYPIGSGVAEGACRHLVKDRMEGTGMRWRIPGAQAMLDLRAVYLNDEWGRFHVSRIEQERQRLYPHRAWIEQQWPRAA